MWNGTGDQLSSDPTTNHTQSCADYYYDDDADYDDDAKTQMMIRRI